MKNSPTLNRYAYMERNSVNYPNLPELEKRDNELENEGSGKDKMKGFYEYISCICALFFSGISILVCIIIRETNIIIIFNAVLAIFCWGYFFYEYRKDKYLQKNARFVRGKVIKDSVRRIPFMKELSIIEVLITYYEPETERTLLFKGRYVESIFRYHDICKIDGDIFVLVGYNPLNVKQYIVYLKDALEGI